MDGEAAFVHPSAGCSAVSMYSRTRRTVLSGGVRRPGEHSYRHPNSDVRRLWRGKAHNCAMVASRRVLILHARPMSVVDVFLFRVGPAAGCHNTERRYGHPILRAAAVQHPMPERHPYYL